jgi:hypothetical protein
MLGDGDNPQYRLNWYNNSIILIKVYMNIGFLVSPGGILYIIVMNRGDYFGIYNSQRKMYMLMNS